MVLTVPPSLAVLLDYKGQVLSVVSSARVMDTDRAAMFPSLFFALLSPAASVMGTYSTSRAALTEGYRGQGE